MQNVYEICFYGGFALAVLLLIAAIILFIVLKIPKVIGDLTGSTARKTMKAMENGELIPGSLSKKEQEKYYNLGTGKITVKKAVSSKEERKKLGNDSTELLEKDKPADTQFQETDILRPGVNDYEMPKAQSEVKPQADVVNNRNAASDIVEEKTENTQMDNDSETVVLSKMETKTDSQVGDDDETAVLTENGTAVEADTPDGNDNETEVLTENESVAEADAPVGDDNETEVLTENESAAETDTPVGDDNETEVLTENESAPEVDAPVGDDNETEVLAEQETTVETATQSGDDNETAVLTEEDAETDVLHIVTDEAETDVLGREEDTNELALSSGILAKKVKVLYNVLVVHTEESLQVNK